MFRSSFSSISPMSSKHGTVALLHSSPLHPSHAATHFKPLFRQEHRFVPQTFRDDNLHLHRMITKRFSGAASLSVITAVDFLPFPILWIFNTFIQRFTHSHLKVYAQTVEVGSSFSWCQSLWIDLHSISCKHIHVFCIAQTIQ